MNEVTLTHLIFACGIGQLSILTASALVPFRLQWRATFRNLPHLHTQLYWIYGGYVVLSIIAIALISLVNSRELAQGSLLARSFCVYVCVFWGVRLSLQRVLNVTPYLTTCWLYAGYHLLSVMFLSFTVVYGWAALAIR